MPNFSNTKTPKEQQDERNFSESLKEYRRQQKEIHNLEVQEKYNEIHNEKFDEYLLNYKIVKQMKWWSWIISVGLAILFTGLSLLIGYLLINSTNEIWKHWKASANVLSIISTFLLFVIFIIGFIKNQTNQSFWNDKRKRYAKTYSETEAKFLLARKIVSLSFLLVLIPTIVLNILAYV